MFYPETDAGFFWFGFEFGGVLFFLVWLGVFFWLLSNASNDVLVGCNKPKLIFIISSFNFLYFGFQYYSTRYMTPLLINIFNPFSTAFVMRVVF